MLVLNYLIKIANKLNLCDTIYDIAGILAVILFYLFLFFYRKNYKISVLKAIIIISIVFIVGCHYLSRTLTWIAKDFTGWGSNNIVRVYVYLPILFLICKLLTRIHFNTIADFVTPGIPLLHAICRFGCMFAGCCYGIPCDWGIWNRHYNTLLFPIQLIECLVLLLLVLILIKRAKATQYQAKGFQYPLFLIMFGTTRFFLEFLRNNNKLFWGISDLALHALFAALVGAIWYYILIRKEKNAAAPETT